MKKTIWISMLAVLVSVWSTDAQLLKKLGKTAEKAAERTVQNRVARETAKKTDQALDSVLDPGSKGNDQDRGVYGAPTGSYPGDGQPNTGNDTSTGPGVSGDPKSIQVYSKFDFVPGDKQIFFDDFGNDFIGDFPAKWNTNSSGEIVTMDDSSQKWLELRSGINNFFIPDVASLPEDYTIEFDVLAMGLDRKTASTTILKIGLSDHPTFNWGKYATVDIPFCQYSPVGFYVRNGGDIANSIEGDIRDKVLGKPHISIAVNNQRFRLWVDEKKYVDIPRLIPSGVIPTTIKFEARNFKDGKERIFITNIKVAEGGVDLRRKLISEGKISTNAILFETGSANLQPQSMGVIRQVSQVLMQETDLSLKIVGHTDSDGNDATNRDLSKRRAKAVKNALVSVYNIDEGRLKTDGKGEADPVADNSTVEGKAQNRRVEFIKI